MSNIQFLVLLGTILITGAFVANDKDDGGVLAFLSSVLFTTALIMWLF